MNLIVDNVYHLSGEGFAESVLENNNNLFRFSKVDATGDWVFRGVTTDSVQWCCPNMIKTGEAVIKPAYPKVAEEKPKRTKRKKGKRKASPSVNKATIVYNGSVEYTVKDFLSIEVTAEKTVFIMEDNTKGTVNYRQAITVPNDDVVGIFVRGVNHQFELDMSLTNLGTVILKAEGAEMYTSSINMTV